MGTRIQHNNVVNFRARQRSRTTTNSWAPYGAAEVVRLGGPALLRMKRSGFFAGPLFYLVERIRPVGPVLDIEVLEREPAGTDDGDSGTDDDSQDRYEHCHRAPFSSVGTRPNLLPNCVGRHGKRRERTKVRNGKTSTVSHY